MWEESEEKCEIELRPRIFETIGGSSGSTARWDRRGSFVTVSWWWRWWLVWYQNTGYICLGRRSLAPSSQRWSSSRRGKISGTLSIRDVYIMNVYDDDEGSETQVKMWGNCIWLSENLTTHHYKPGQQDTHMVSSQHNTRDPPISPLTCLITQTCSALQMSFVAFKVDCISDKSQH